MFPTSVLCGILALLNPFADVFEGDGCRFCWMFEAAAETAEKAEQVEIRKPVERSRRILLLTAGWCEPCKVLKGSFPWLRKSGWLIGPGPDSHIQLIDVDERPELWEKWRGRSEGIPLAVLIEDGKKLGQQELPSAWGLIDLFNKRL